MLTIINENYEGLILQKDHLIYNGDYFIHNGDINIETDTVISIPLIIKGNLHVNGNLTSHKKLKVWGEININGDFVVADVKAGNIFVGGNLVVDREMECLGNLTVLGNITAQNIYAMYNVTCYGVVTACSIKAETVIAAQYLNVTRIGAGNIRTAAFKCSSYLSAVNVVTYSVFISGEVNVVGGIYPPAEDILTVKKYY